MARKRRILGFISVVSVTALFFGASLYLAPLAANIRTLNPYYFLNLGAPAVFHVDPGDVSASLKVEPWRLLGMQLPAFASIEPSDWQPLLSVTPGVVPTPAPLPQTGQVLIYHTHTSEAFVPTSGTARSEDPEQTVARLGQAMAARLEAAGVPVTQSRRCNDSQYNRSYVESRDDAQQLLAASPSTVLLIDLHRDGVGNTAEIGRKVTTAAIGDKLAGQIMFVLSSAHENWHLNNRVANDLHNLLEDKYPGLSRGILVRPNSTYNQDLHPGALLVEVGGHWNTLAEAIYGAELFAEILIEYLGGAR